jgi:DNA-binding transcriptional LysR family regulator
MGRLEEMEAFLRTAEAHSFTAAAERLGMSKSMVSQRISELEARLGVRLLHRTTRRLSLTDAGASFLERCQRILAETDEAEEAVTRDSAALRGTLRLAAPLSFALLHLKSAIVEFMALHPALDIVLNLDDRIVDLIGGGYDLAIRVGVLPDSSLVARRLAPIRIACCCSPAYVAAHGLPARPEDLPAHACLLYSGNGQGDIWGFRTGNAGMQIRVDGRFSANNGEILVEAALKGMGIALLPTFLVGPYLTSGALVRVLEEWPVQEGAIYAVYPQSRHLPGRVRAFADFLAERIGKTPYWDCPSVIGP